MTRWAITWHFPQILNSSYRWFYPYKLFSSQTQIVTPTLQGAYIVSCYKDNICSKSQAGYWNIGMRCYGQLGMHFTKNVMSQVSSPYTVVFWSMDTISPCFHNCCLSQLSLPTFELWAAFLQEHVSISHNTIVYVIFISHLASDKCFNAHARGWCNNAQGYICTSRRQVRYVTDSIIASSECTTIKTCELAECFIADHVTFSQSGGGFSVAESF